MIVELEFLLAEETLVPEAGLAAALAADPGARPGINEVVGSLVLKDGDTELKIADEISWVVPKFAFETVPELARSGAAQFSFWSFDGVLDLKRCGCEVEISSRFRETMRFPLNALMSATLDAGDRFLDLVDTHWPEDPVLDRPAMRSQAMAARAAIAGL